MASNGKWGHFSASPVTGVQILSRRDLEMVEQVRWDDVADSAQAIYSPGHFA